MVDRRALRNRKVRETLIGIDSSGAEYWIVPFDEAKVGNRKFEVRKSSKKVPEELKGMITDAATAERLFEKWQSKLKAKAKRPAAKKED